MPPPAQQQAGPCETARARRSVQPAHHLIHGWSRFTVVVPFKRDLPPKPFNTQSPEEMAPGPKVLITFIMMRTKKPALDFPGRTPNEIPRPLYPQQGATLLSFSSGLQHCWGKTTTTWLRAAAVKRLSRRFQRAMSGPLLRIQRKCLSTVSCARATASSDVRARLHTLPGPGAGHTGSELQWKLRNCHSATSVNHVTQIQDDIKGSRLFKPNMHIELFKAGMPVLFMFLPSRRHWRR